MRRGIALLALALVATACGDDRGATEPDGPDPVVELSTSSTASTTTTASTSTSAPSSYPTVAPDPCGRSSPFATEADLDGDAVPDLVDVGWICLGTGEAFEWSIPDPEFDGDDPVAWGSDVDADGIDEVLFFTHNEPPVTARIYEFDAAAPGGLRPVLDAGEPFAPGFSLYTGPAGPSGEDWFGCTDLDGSGVERLAVGSFEFDTASEDTRWSLQPVTWGDDLAVVRGEAVTGAFPAWEEDPSALMPGRRFCKVDERSPRIADGCSAEGLAVPDPPAVLPAPAAATFSALMDAAVACDFHELERIAGEEITLSFGGHNDVAAFFAMYEYLFDDAEPLRVLVELARMEPASHLGNGELWTWPGFFADDEPATPTEIAQIEAIFGMPWDEVISEIGYIDWRLGIGSDGDWAFFVAGD